MKKQISLMFGIILLFGIGIISALNINISAGDSYTFNIGTTEKVYWNISGIEEEYLNITQDGANITITTNKYFSSDSNFKIDFYTLGKEQSSDSSSGGSGGGSSKVKLSICKERWECYDWEDCINSEQKRVCIDLNQCGTTAYKPITFRFCSEENISETLPLTQSSTGFFAKITGAVTGFFAKSRVGIILIVVLITMLVGGIVFFRRRKKLTKK